MVVVGAGLVGLAVAFELAERGATVRVFDRAEPARGASWAGAGLLAPYSEIECDDALFALGSASLHEYPRFVERVEAASGLNARLRLDGVLHAAFDAREIEGLRVRQGVFAQHGVSSELLERGEVLAAEPWLGPRAGGGLLVHAEGSVDNRRLGRALAAACEARGVTLSRAHVLRVECDRRRVLGLATDLGFVSAGAVVNAAGAWAGQLAGVPASCIPPEMPVKGQMLALAVPAELVSRPTWTTEAYFVPRADGRLLIGATVESAGFDERVTAHGVHALLHGALSAAPALGPFAVTESWAGLRPGTPDGRPFLGRTPLQGYYLATGHYRNGILLAPATARLVADAVEDRDGSALAEFSIERANPEERLERRITHA